MCGFVGFINRIDNSNVVLEKMMDRIKHRGPDAEGRYIDSNIALGHRRLSIIDVSSQGDQPIYNEDSSMVLVFHGEIYNYKKIKQYKNTTLFNPRLCSSLLYMNLINQLPML